MSNYFHASNPLERPGWWCPEKVLERMQAGERAPKIVAEASEETGGKVTKRALQTDILRWRQSATWSEPFQAADKLWKGKHGGGMVLSDHWHQDFYDALEQPGEDEGKIAAACEACGIGPALVYALRDKRNKCYDPDFDEQVRIREGARMSKIRENVLNEAQNGDGKVGLKVLESAMPNLHAPQHKIAVEGKLEVEHTGLPATVVVSSAERTKALWANREARALPPGDERSVIDLTPVAQKERA